MQAVGFPQDDDDLIGGRYRIISRLGEGGMGTAYRAWDEQEGVPVVIKIPKKIFLEDPKFAERFYREIRLLQGLTHPHIVPIRDVGEHEGLPYVVMRFLPGGSLSNRRLRDGQGKPRRNPAPTLHLWLPAVADALDYVHSQGVVHRDVKPANIFFDAFWGAYLGDFGIAKVVEESDTFDKEHTLTATHMGIGTQEYMCPEQFTPKAVIDGRADQYALAVMVYEMLAGTRPFTGATAHLIVEVTTHQAPSLEVHRRDLPVSLVEAVHRGLAKRPEERFATCRELASAVLRDVPPIEDEPGVARLLCPKCSNILKLPTEAAGRKGSCPKCRTQMKVADDLGALWLLDEARRQRKSVSSPEAFEAEQDAGVVIDYTEDEAIEAFKPVSSTTPIEKAARREARKVPPIAIWGGLAAALLAAVVIWNLLPGSGSGSKKRPKPQPLSYEEKLAQAEATLKSDASDRAANELLGRHWCFKEQNWDKGLPFFAKSNTVGFTSAAEKELKARDAAAASPGDLVRAAQDWWKLAKQPDNSKETAAAITKHAAAIYSAAAGDLTVAKDIDDANRWLDRDSEFRALVGNKRPTPPKVRPDDAQVILAQPPLVNSIGMKLKLMPAGTFRMGDDNGEPDEKPLHQVTLTKPFYLGVHEVTNAQWKRMMVRVPSLRKDDDRPVESVSWQNAMEFCKKLSALPEEQKAGRVYRLPTEAEWEYACRAGTTTRWSFGDDESKLGEYAWFNANSEGQTHAVGQKKANPAGLFDMHGNVWEWCSDWKGAYPQSECKDPQGPSAAPVRVLRGGSWLDSAASSRSTRRYGHSQSNNVINLGFRVALSPPKATLGDSAGLAPTSSLSAAKAKELVATTKTYLDLADVTVLTPEVASVLATFRGHSIKLDGLPRLESESAKYLATFKHGEGSGELSLNGLNSMSPDAAKAIAQFNGAWLLLDGLTTLSPEVAQGLATFDQVNLHLNGVTTISSETARALSESKCKFLSLAGLKALTPDVAKGFVGWRGTRLCLGGLTELSPQTAEALLDTKGGLEFAGLTSLSDDAARIIGRMKGDGLSLDGLTTLSSKQAQALATFEGRWLGFDRVTTLSLETAQALAGFKGTLWLGSVSELTDDVAQALAEFKGQKLFLEQYNTKLSDSARSILGRNPKIDLD